MSGGGGPGDADGAGHDQVAGHMGDIANGGDDNTGVEEAALRALSGTWGAVLLPLGPEDAIDFGRLGQELDVLVASGLAGIYTCGTAGEFHALDESEYEALSELVAAKSSASGTAFQLGASHMSGQICLSRIRRARQLGPVAIQVTLPDWLALSPQEVHEAMGRMVAEASPVPLVLYNPPHAKTVCSAEQLAALAHAFEGLAGVKVANDHAFYRQLHALAPRLLIFAPGHELAHVRGLGVAGSYSNVACLQPGGAAAWDKQMSTDPAGAMDLGRRIMAFFDSYIGPLKAQGFSNTALDKTLATIGGWAPIGTQVRWPYASVAPEVAQRLAPLARAALPELF